MSDQFKSFDGAALKNFIQSPLKARNPGEDALNLGFIIVNCFKAHVGFEKECPPAGGSFPDVPCVKRCHRRFLRRRTEEHVFLTGVGGAVTEVFTHIHEVRKDRFSLLETDVINAWGAPDQMDAESLFFQFQSNFIFPPIIDSITDSETGYSFAWHIPFVEPDGSRFEYGTYKVDFSDEYTLNDPTSAFDVTKDLAALWVAEDRLVIPWPDFTDPLVKFLSVDPDSGAVKRFWTIKIERLYDANGQKLTFYNVMPSGAGATVWPPQQPLFVQFWADTGADKPPFFDDIVSYNDPLATPFFNTIFGFYPPDPAGDTAPDAFLGSWFTYGTKMLLFDGQNYVLPGRRNMHVRPYSKDWGPRPTSDFKYTGWTHDFSDDPFYDKSPPDYPFGCAQPPVAPYSRSFGAVVSAHARVTQLPAPDFRVVDWMSNDAVKILLFKWV